MHFCRYFLRRDTTHLSFLSPPLRGFGYNKAAAAERLAWVREAPHETSPPGSRRQRGGDDSASDELPVETALPSSTLPPEPPGTAADGGRPWSELLINVSPLTPGHFLLVPAPPQQPQQLTVAALRLGLSLARASQRDDLRLMFNSLGAWAR